MKTLLIANGGTPAIKSVANGFSALEYIVEKTLESDGATLAEIADYLEMQKSTARNLLQTLEICGYVERSGFGFYRLGEKCRRLSRVSETGNRLRTLSSPALAEFTKRNHQMIFLSIFFNGKRHLSLALNEAGIPIDVSSQGDDRRNVFRRAASRLLYAFSSPDEQNRFLEIFGRPEEKDWPEGAADLQKATAQIRADGAAFNEKNLVTGMIGIAVGIFNREEELCAALSTSIPQIRWRPEQKEPLLKELRRTSRALSELLVKERLL